MAKTLPISSRHGGRVRGGGGGLLKCEPAERKKASNWSLVPMIQLSDSPTLSRPQHRLPWSRCWHAALADGSLVFSYFILRRQRERERGWLSKSLCANHIKRHKTAVTTKPRGCGWHLYLNDSIHKVQQYYSRNKTAITRTLRTLPVSWKHCCCC